MKWIHVIILEKCSYVQYFYPQINNNQMQRKLFNTSSLYLYIYIYIYTVYICFSYNPLRAAVMLIDTPGTEYKEKGGRRVMGKEGGRMEQTQDFHSGPQCPCPRGVFCTSAMRKAPNPSLK